jgi:hypothetical protein
MQGHVRVINCLDIMHTDDLIVTGGDDCRVVLYGLNAELGLNNDPVIKSINP